MKQDRQETDPALDGKCKVYINFITVFRIVHTHPSKSVLHHGLSIYQMVLLLSYPSSTTSGDEDDAKLYIEYLLSVILCVVERLGRSAMA